MSHARARSARRRRGSLKRSHRTKARLAWGEAPSQARDFYESTLGLPVKFAVPQAGVVGYRLGTEEPGLMIRVQAMAPSPARDTPRVWLEVKDARAAAKALRDNGAVLLTEPLEILTGWAVEIADPWGNVLGLTDYVKDPAKGRKTP